jgi:hypothetical protein
MAPQARPTPEAAEAPAAPQALAAPAPGTPLTRQAMEAYQAIEQAGREGNWTRFGQELNRLGGILRDLESQSR